MELRIVFLYTTYNEADRLINNEAKSKYHGSEYHIGSGKKDTGKGNPFTVRNRFKTADTSFGSGKPVHIRGVHRILYRERNHTEHEQSRIQKFRLYCYKNV